MNDFFLKCLGLVFFSPKITGFSPRFGEKKTFDISEKNHLFGKNNGRFSNIGIKLTPQRFLFFCRLCRIHFVVFCGISAFPLIAEWGVSDSERLTNIQNSLDNIEANQLTAFDFENSNKINVITDSLSTIEAAFNFVGYGQTFASAINSISQKISDIYNYQKLPQDGAGYQNWVNLQKLPSIANSLGYAGGYQNTLKYDNSQIIQHLADIEAALTSSDSSSELLKEETFVEKFDGFTSAFGFSDGSGGNYRELIYPFYNSFVEGYLGDVILYYLEEQRKSETEPFPGNSYKWLSENYSVQDYSYLAKDPFSYIGQVISTQSFYEQRVAVQMAKKQAWNDWQAHTNLVSTIIAQADRFFVKPEDTQKDATFSEGKLITPSSGTGSADTEIDLRPVFTNDFTTIEEERDAFTNEFAFLSNEEIKQRYVSDTILETSNVQVYQDDSGGKWNTVVTIPVTSGGSFVIDFAQAYDKYRLMVTPDSLKRFRGIFEIFWYASCSIAAFFIVLKVSGISHDKGE